MVRTGLAAIVCLWLADFGAVVAGANLNSVRIAGREYVSARDLNRYYNLGGNNVPSLALNEHRRNITIDGVENWLSFPVIAASGQLWVSKQDVLMTLDQILRPQQFRRQGPVQLVVLDPGHGGADRGTRSRTGRAEKWMTLDLAKRIQKQLAANGVDVAMTRTTDRTLDLSDRTEYAARKRADLFVSIHFNAALGSVRGIETYCLTPVGAASTAGGVPGRDSLPGHRYIKENIWLAHCVQKSLIRLTDAPDRGVRRARFQVLREAPCPAVLVEAGFLSSSVEERNLLTTEYRDLLAKAIADGILTYRKSLE